MFFHSPFSSRFVPPTPKPLFLARQAMPRCRAPDLSCMSPPYRKIRALRLMDTPETPKTIIQKLKDSVAVVPDTKSQDNDSDTDDYFLARGDQHTKKPLIAPSAMNPHQPLRAVPIPIHHHHYPAATTANVNPFTPDGMLMNSKKRARIDKCALTSNTTHKKKNAVNTNSNNEQRRSVFDPFYTANYDSKASLDSKSISTEEEDLMIYQQAPKRLALQDTNISRYEREFVQLSVIGAGEFGEVFRCLNRLDGCIYAVKKSKKPVAGSAVERIALNEVWAHAVLGKHDNVVRYYSAWAENNHMLIQNEYCDGGSLQALLQTRSRLTEPELRLLVLHIAEGLRYIHSNDLVHLDLKVRRGDL